MDDQCGIDGHLHELSLFTGAGGGLLGSAQLGWHTICGVEIEPYAASVLAQRQNDGLLPPFPVWDDICTFDGYPWQGRVDVVSGGFPCQDISSAGRGAGITGSQSSLWSHMARVVGEVRPPYVFVENSPTLTTRGLGIVLGDLATLGYDARWGVLGAADVGAPHQRDRIWILAHTHGADLRKLSRRWHGTRGTTQPPQPQHHGLDGKMAHAHGQRCQPGQSPEHLQQGRPQAVIGRVSMPDAHRLDAHHAGPDPSSVFGTGPETADLSRGVTHSYCQQCQSPPHQGKRQGATPSTPIVWDHWAIEPDVGRVAHGVAARVDRIRALGNGQVPQCMAEAWRRLVSHLPNGGKR